MLAILIGGACFLPTDTCACVYPPENVLWVSGTVSSDTGAPAPYGAYVRAAAYSETCPVIQPGAPDGAVQAELDAAGRFRVGLRQGVPMLSACVRVRAYRRVGDESPATVERTGLRIGLGADGKPLDSLRVSLVLP